MLGICSLFRCIGGSCINCIMCAGTLVVVAVILVVLYTKGDPTNFLTMQDPPGLNSTSKWQTNGQDYLQIQLYNSFDDKYTAYFDEYVDKWNSGSPDVLNLSSVRMTPDSTCPPYTGKINTCNNNFGKTDWRGITALVTENNYVIHAVVKMNDYYLDKEGDLYRKYTMCHELGHSFGLPHTDENYYNLDRGDCMDYTTRPRNNLLPGQYNFDLLAEMYGPAEYANATKNDTGSLFDTTVFPGASTFRNWFDEDKNSTGRKLASSEVKEKYQVALHDIENGDNHATFPTLNIKPLSRGSKHASYDVDLGEGYQLLVHKLLVDMSE
jgi:hypothetical protein